MKYKSQTYEEFVAETQDPILLAIDKDERDAGYKEISGYLPDTIEFIKNKKEGGVGELSMLRTRYLLKNRQHKRVWGCIIKGMKQIDIAAKLNLSTGQISKIIAAIERTEERIGL